MTSLPGTLMLARAMLTGTLMLPGAVLARTVLARAMLTVTMLAPAVLAGAVLTVTTVTPAMLTGAILASAVPTARVHADVHAVVLALVHMDVDGVLARVYADVHGILAGINADVRTGPGTTARARAMSAVNVNIHVPGVVGSLDVDELVDPVPFGHGFLR